MISIALKTLFRHHYWPRLNQYHWKIKNWPEKWVSHHRSYRCRQHPSQHCGQSFPLLRAVVSYLICVRNTDFYAFVSPLQHPLHLKIWMDHKWELELWANHQMRLTAIDYVESIAVRLVNDVDHRKFNNCTSSQIFRQRVLQIQWIVSISTASHSLRFQQESHIGQALRAIEFQSRVFVIRFKIFAD